MVAPTPPAPTPTPEPTATPGTSGDELLPLGTPGAIGDWTITVTEVKPDHTAAVLAENQFNDSPVEGRQFFAATVEARYDGDDSGSLLMELTFRAVRAAGLVYDWEDDCGVAPNELNLLGEVFRGGVQTGDLCWSVRTDDIASLFIFVEEAFSFSDARLWLALAPPP